MTLITSCCHIKSFEDGGKFKHSHPSFVHADSNQIIEALVYSIIITVCFSDFTATSGAAIMNKIYIQYHVPPVLTKTNVYSNLSICELNSVYYRLSDI